MATITPVYSSFVEKICAAHFPAGHPVFASNNEKTVEPDESPYDGLLHAIYAVLDHSGAWKDFCAQLLKSAGAASVHICAFNRQLKLFSYGAGFNISQIEPLELIQPLYHKDARLEWLRAFPSARWLHFSDTASARHTAGQPVFEPFALAAGHRQVSMCKLIDDDALTVMLACRRDAAQGPLPAAARALLERLGPHLVRVARLCAQRHGLNASGLAHRATPPAMLVSANGEVLHSNEPALRLLRATSLVRVRSRQLALAAPHQARLQEDIAISEARLRTRGNGALAAAARFRAIRIVADESNERAGPALAPPAASGPEVLYVFYNVLTPGDASAAEPRALAALTFYHPRSTPPVDEQVLATAFDLTPAECRIAHLLAEGLTQKEIAARVGVQHDTVRKQLQSVFQKTATRRQPDLLRLLLHLPARPG
jgi:DNA-binding CsgD family transcriptional regulator